MLNNKECKYNNTKIKYGNMQKRRANGVPNHLLWISGDILFASIFTWYVCIILQLKKK